MADAPFVLPAGLPADPTLFATLLDLLPLGVMYYTPVVDAAGTLTDLALAYLNPAAQRMTRLSAQPDTTYRQQFPTTDANGAWDFHRRTWLGQEAGQFQFYYQADGFDAYFRVTAQRLGEGLLAIFTDTQDEGRSAAEEALRQSQAREQEARRQAEAGRQRFYDVLRHLPALVAVYEGPELVYTFTNDTYQRYFPAPTQLLGRPLREVLPETEEQGVVARLEQVYRTGEPYYVEELEVWLDFHGGGQRSQQVFLNLLFHPLRNAQGQVSGVLDYSYDVTAQVQARQQVEQLNLDLETRVQERTRVAHAAQAEAEHQRQQLQQVLLQLPMPLLLLQGPTHVAELANAQYQQLFPQRQLAGIPLREGLPELDGQGVFEVLDHVYHTGEPVQLPEAEFWADFGGTGQVQRRYYNSWFLPFRDGRGQITGVLNPGFDVTEQVLARQRVEQFNQELEARVLERTRQVAAAQAATERERAQLQALIAQAPVAIALFEGDDLRVTSANAVIAALWGYSPAHVVGRPLLEAVPELQGQGFDNLLRQVLHTQVPFTGTETPALLRRAGQLHTTYFNFVYQPFYATDGQVAGVLCVAVDVTAQVLARQQVEQLNQELEARVQARTRQLQTLFAQAPVALVVLRGPQFIIEQANAQAERIWGVAVADVLGRPHFEAIPGSAGQGFEEMLTGVLATGEAVVLREVLIELARAHTSQPGQGYYNVIFKPLFDEDQPQATGIVVMWTETTDQVLARQQVQELNEELAAINEELTATNEELNESNTQLTRTNVDLDNFIYTASHDLKAPITNIEGLLLALEHEMPAADRPGDVSLMLTMMQEAIERFRRTIAHLTDLSRLQKEHTPDADAVALAPVVEAVRLDLTPLLTHTQGQLTVMIPEGLTVTFAEKNLRSVVYNLLSNAFKYHHPDRPARVQLRSWYTIDYAVLEVQDNGLGLDLTQGQERLFAMFQRLHTHVEGTGVGLYMVKRILENAGGRIEVSSQLGRGTTFHVYFRRF